MKEKQIDIYINIDSTNILIGCLFVEISRGKEVYSFSYDDTYLNSQINYVIDPELSLTKGRQFKKDSSTIYGFIADSIPDRWGRNLLLRNEKFNARKENRNPEKLCDSDFLLGVNDFTRQGALRFKLHNENEFLTPSNRNSVPTLIYINKLEQMAFNADISSDEDIKDLFSPGSSLGGARPKATIFDNDGNLYIAKFSHRQDDYDVPKMEYFVNLLADICGLSVPQCRLIKGNKSIFLVKRFDRNGPKRIPYVSAMTLLGATDGDSEAYSYLDLVDLIKTYSSNPTKDLFEMYKRMIFNCIIHNGDDHLRNHGFIFVNKGYELSPIFDINPNPDSIGLSLSLDGFDHMFNFDTCLSLAKYFGIKDVDALTIINDMRNKVSSNFDKIAKQLKIKETELIRFKYMKNVQ